MGHFQEWPGSGFGPLGAFKGQTRGCLEPPSRFIIGLRIDKYNPTRIISSSEPRTSDGVIDEATGKPLLNRYYTLRLVPQPKEEN